MNRMMTQDEINSGTVEINNEAIDFEYFRVLGLVKDDDYLKKLYKETDSNYEKLHIYRVIYDDSDSTGSLVLNKFINQAFHIENEYIYQLNPCKYQLVPQYVIDECDKVVNGYTLDEH